MDGFHFTYKHRTHVVWPVTADPEARDLSLTNGCGSEEAKTTIGLNIAPKKRKEVKENISIQKLKHV